MKNTFSIIFNVRKTKALKDGKSSVYCRATLNGDRAEFVVQSNVEFDQWDHIRGRAKGFTKQAKELNQQLDFVRSKLIEHKNFMEQHNEIMSIQELKNKYFGVDTKSKTLLTIFQEHNDKCVGLLNKDFAQGTIERYQTCYKHVERFIIQKYNKKDVFLHEINPMFISDFEYYLKTTRNCNNNSTVKYIKNLKKIIRIAMANGWLKSDPFVNIKHHIDEVDMAFLTPEELQKINDKKFNNARLQQVKDAYLFSCYTGLAYIDVKQLTPDEIVTINGQLWIKKKRQKTKNWCNVPLLPPAIEIINKYKNNTTCMEKGVVLPILTNQKMNSYLKEIADMCDIDKKLSTHTARHTFATTVTLANQVSMEVVSKMLGHSGINMTKKYARVVDDLIQKDMSKLFDIYK